ncbi:hypothetical protein [Streptomyces sp. NBC_01530]|uniref:hypothetical protein n=1 Tax=Streptomyces sp. NBC_01530 TaxID=2903895 RepID=UPI00386FF93B
MEPGPKDDPGPACPNGYSLQVPATDPDAPVCRNAGAGALASAPAPAAVLPVLPALRRRDRVE